MKRGFPGKAPFLGVAGFLLLSFLPARALCQELKGEVKLGVEVKAEGENVVSAIAKLLDKQEEELSKVADSERTEEGVKIKMKSQILFDFDSYELKETAKSELTKLAQVLLKYPENVIVVAGHTDNVGEDSYNQLLSENRAQAVANFLVSLGISRQSVTYVGYGESQPVATNDTPEGQELNRRVELDITVDEKKFVMKHPMAVAPPPACPAQPPEKRYTDRLTMELSGEIFFSGEISENDYTRIKFQLGPSLGIFVVKGLVIGLSPIVTYDRNDPEGPGNLELTIEGGALIYIGYVFDVHKVVFPYLKLGIGGLGGKTSEASVTRSKSSFAAAPEAGLKFTVGKNGLLTLGFRYMYQNAKFSDKSTRDHIHSFYLGFGVGFWFDLEKKKKDKKGEDK